MKSWKRETINCGLIVIFATIAWWWVSKEYKNSLRAPTPYVGGKILPIKIYRGVWKKGGYLEINKK